MLNGSTLTISINHCEGSCIGKSLLGIHKIIRLSFNELRVNDRHYLLNRDNVTQPLQMQLSEKKETFSQFFFFTFLESILNFIHLTRKDDPPS